MGEWLGQPITLELEHKDGVHQNNIRENLECLCPNCHSQTDTWRRKKDSNHINENLILQTIPLVNNMNQLLLRLNLRWNSSNRIKNLMNDNNLTWR